MKEVKVKLNGLTSILMHRDNVSFSETVTKWRKNPENKDLSVNGDDRSPAWTWLGSVYHDKGFVCVPRDYMMSAIRGAAAKITLKGKQTYKKQSQSDIVIMDMGWMLKVNGNPIPWDKIKELQGNTNFDDHENLASKLGFSLDVRRVTINGKSKHVRVRPMFSDWSIEGSIILAGEVVTPEILKQILEIAGRYQGFGNWRPGSNAAGPYGQFEVEEFCG